MRSDCSCIPITHAQLSPISDSTTLTHVLNIPFCHSPQLQISSPIALLPQSIPRKPIFDPFPYPPCSAPPTQQRPFPFSAPISHAPTAAAARSSGPAPTPRRSPRGAPPPPPPPNRSALCVTLCATPAWSAVRFFFGFSLVLQLLQ